jgi:toxin YoeB
MRNIAFEKRAFKEFTEWSSIDKKIHTKSIELINDILRTPFMGIGKPEPLKHELQGYWSRRITYEHRLVYKISEQEVLILSCKSNY